MGKSKSAKKKNHVSKHILKSREDDVTASADAGDKSSTPSKKKKSSGNSHIKHPDEAASYLTQWKKSKSEDSSIRASSSWKFNKNTQSWLIRHMYEVDKVPKSTFILLMDYLEGLEGRTIIDRMRTDASRRCRRHKEYSRDSTAPSGDTEDDPTGNDDENENAQSSETIDTTPGNKEELEYEEALWRKMDDHDKRKQYKRARKILDLMKKINEEKSN